MHHSVLFKGCENWDEIVLKVSDSHIVRISTVDTDGNPDQSFYDSGPAFESKRRGANWANACNSGSHPASQAC